LYFFAAFFLVAFFADFFAALLPAPFFAFDFFAAFFDFFVFLVFAPWRRPATSWPSSRLWRRLSRAGRFRCRLLDAADHGFRRRVREDSGPAYDEVANDVADARLRLVRGFPIGFFLGIHDALHD